MSEIVFILGAGASREAGAPLMGDFIDKAREIHRRGESDKFKDDFDRIFQAISSLQSVHSKSQLNIDNIESIFAAFEMGQLINRLPGMSNSDTESLFVSMKRVIYKTLEKAINFKGHKDEIVAAPPDSYHSFAKLLDNLNSEGKQSRCSIITFNYDLALDYALYFTRQSVDYCMIQVNEQRRYIPLMKLHGSLNWAECQKCGEIIPWDFDNFFQKFRFHPFLKPSDSVRLDVPSKLSSCGIEHCGQYVQSEPFIIPPTWNKTMYHPRLSRVWSRAASELSNAENIFVIGYSLPESDYFFRQLYALGSVGSTIIRRFWVFNPDTHDIVRPRFEKLIGYGIKSRFMFERVKFTKAIEILGTAPIV